MRQIFLRDLTLATRSGGGFGLALAFFLIVIVLSVFAIGQDTSALQKVAPGLLWLGALLSCLLSLDRIFGLDFEDGSLDQMAVTPMPLEMVALSKSAAHWITTGLPLCLCLPLLGLMLNLPFSTGILIALTLLIGTPALSLIGAFANALTLGVKRGGLLMSLLVLPLYIPTLILGAEAARRITLDLPYTTPLMLLGGLTLLVLAIGPLACAAALRITLR